MHVGDGASQATAGTEPEGHAEAGLPAFGAVRRVAVDVESVRLRKNPGQQCGTAVGGKSRVSTGMV